MRKPPLALVLALFGALAAAPAKGAISWIRDDPETAFHDAKVQQRPLLIYFHTIWCSWCMEYEDKVFTDDDVTDKSNFFVPLRLNADRREGIKFATRYNVLAFPTILVLTPEGKVIGRLGSYRPVPGFLKFLDECLTPSERLEAIDGRIDGGDRSPDLLLKSADRHFDALDLDLAAKRYEQAAASDPDARAGVADAARLGLARLKLSRGDAAAALEQYRIVLGSYPASERLAEAFVGAIGILRDQKKHTDIDALFAEFATKFPNDPAVLNDHARRLLESGKDREGALARAGKAVELSPANPDYKATLTRALLAANRATEAMSVIDAAIEQRPADKDLRILRLEVVAAVRNPAARKP